MPLVVGIGLGVDAALKLSYNFDIFPQRFLGWIIGERPELQSVIILFLPIAVADGHKLIPAICDQRVPDCAIKALRPL